MLLEITAPLLSSGPVRRAVSRPALALAVEIAGVPDGARAALDLFVVRRADLPRMLQEEVVEGQRLVLADQAVEVLPLLVAVIPRPHHSQAQERTFHRRAEREDRVLLAQAQHQIDRRRLDSLDLLQVAPDVAQH